LAVVGIVLSAAVATACSTPLYTFPDLPSELPPGERNLLKDSSFEQPNLQLCLASVGCPLGWSLERTTEGPADYSQTSTGAITGQNALSLHYAGQRGDDGHRRFIEVYQGASGPATITGQHLSFEVWVSGSCKGCAPFIGIEAFDKESHYLGESDQYFNVPKRPRAVMVAYVLPPATYAIAAYLQVPEIYHNSDFQLYIDDTSLVSTTP
jgi:hypothetical protein